jgi:hypothetical protein
LFSCFWYTNKITSTELLLVDSSKLLAFKENHKVQLANIASIHKEPNKEAFYVSRDKEHADLEKELVCLGKNLYELKDMQQEKHNCRTIEYATISGAGKSRFVLRQLGEPKFHDIPMSLVALNFNGGTGGGSDLRSGEEKTPEKYMSRLLLSRGLLGVHPDMKFLTGERVPDQSLPDAKQVIDALFLDRFTDPPGEGLLIVHLDELWLLKDDTNDRWIKEFICILLEYTADRSNNGRYVLPLVTHTCPDSNLLLNPEYKSTLYAPKRLHLYPFSLTQSIELLTHLRSESGGSHVDDIKWAKWEKVIALAGGHPALLVGSMSLLKNGLTIVEHNPVTEAAMTVGLVTCDKMKRFKQSIQALESGEASAFIMDCLLRRDVNLDTHAKCLKSGIGWYQPNEHGTKGRVSTPFPILVNLMHCCNDEKFASIATALDPLALGFSPTKAMEYVSALAVLLRRTGCIDTWKNVPTLDGFEIVERATDPFFTVWKLPNQAVIDFGGLHDGWKILGQSKMQEPGADTAQALGEVLDVAWKIGHRVAAGELTGKLHAYFVSSRREQPISELRKLIHACRVAMSGIISEGNAKLKLENAGEKVNVYKFIDLLGETTADDKYLFTYVGHITNQLNGEHMKKARTAADGGSILNLEDILPKGVFAGWG